MKFLNSFFIEPVSFVLLKQFVFETVSFTETISLFIEPAFFCFIEPACFCFIGNDNLFFLSKLSW